MLYEKNTNLNNLLNKATKYSETDRQNIISELNDIKNTNNYLNKEIQELREFKNE